MISWRRQPKCRRTQRPRHNDDDDDNDESYNKNDLDYDAEYVHPVKHWRAMPPVVGVLPPADDDGDDDDGENDDDDGDEALRASARVHDWRWQR